MRLFSCCGHNKYILSHENQKVRPHRWYVLKSHNGFLSLMQAGRPHQYLLEPMQELPQTLEGTGSDKLELQNALKAREIMSIRENPSLRYFVPLGPFLCTDSLLPSAHLGSYLPKIPCDLKSLLGSHFLLWSTESKAKKSHTEGQHIEECN